MLTRNEVEAIFDLPAGTCKRYRRVPRPGSGSALILLVVGSQQEVLELESVAMSAIAEHLKKKDSPPGCGGCGG